MTDPTDKTEDKYEYEIADGVILDTDKPEIQVIDDTPDEDKGRTPMAQAPADVTDEELTKYSDQKLKDRLAHLGKGYHEERRAKEAALREREEAVRVAQQVVAENQRLQGSLTQNQTVLLEQAKETAKTKLEEAKRAFKAASESFDTDAMMEAQEQITRATTTAERVSNFTPPAGQPQQNVIQPAPQVQQPVLSAKTRAWQDQNRWFGTDEGMTAYSLALHKKVVESGVPVDSEEYYKRIDADVQKRFPEAFAGNVAAPPSRQNRSNVAPASRSTASSKVVLTQTQVNLAKKLGLSLEAYARSVAELNRN